jgi:hypothetical protein
MAGIEEGPMSEAELRELERIMERHKELGHADLGFGVFSSICIPRLLATVRQLQLDLAQVSTERDDALALLGESMGDSQAGGASVL